MKYEVIHRFEDLQDKRHLYNVGDIFPHNELNVSEERLKELSTTANRQRKPLIKAIEEEPLPFSDNDITFETQEEKKYTKTDINRLSKVELQELAINEGIGGAEDMTGSELKENLISHFRL